MRALLAVILLALSTCVSGEDQLMLGLWTKYWDGLTGERDVERNEVNNLLGYSSNGYYIFTMENSAYKRSFSAGWVLDEFCITQYVCLETMVGLVSGYRYKFGTDVAPFIAPRVQIPLTADVNLQIMGIPGYIMGAGFTINF